MAQSNPILKNIRRSLGRQSGEPVPPRPPILPPRLAADTTAEIDLLIKEINLLSGVARRMDRAGLDAALQALVAGTGSAQGYLVAHAPPGAPEPGRAFARSGC